MVRAPKPAEAWHVRTINGQVERSTTVVQPQRQG
jgi:hypothetical protein